MKIANYQYSRRSFGNVRIQFQFEIPFVTKINGQLMTLCHQSIILSSKCTTHSTAHTFPRPLDLGGGPEGEGKVGKERERKEWRGGQELEERG